jgi:hypothetical protein
MNSIENLKSTQLRKLFKVFKSRSMQSSNIFRARKNFLFEFANLSGVWKLEIIFYEARPTCQQPVCILTALTTQRAAQRRWPPIVTAPHGLPPPLSQLRMSPRRLPPTTLLPPTVRQHSSLLCSAPAVDLPPLSY